jgi:DNA-binding transcriptional regulator LsrR (DeoR family)
MVELVHAYSNPKAGLESLPKLLVKAASTPRPHERPTTWQTQVRLDPNQAKELAAAYSAGNAANELAARFGIHRATVTAILHRLGVDLRQRGLIDEQVAEACLLYPEGWSLARLAERYGVDDMTVRRYLLLAGVVMRSPHERCKWLIRPRRDGKA